MNTIEAVQLIAKYEGWKKPLSVSLYWEHPDHFNNGLMATLEELGSEQWFLSLDYLSSLWSKMWLSVYFNGCPRDDAKEGRDWWVEMSSELGGTFYQGETPIFDSIEVAALIATATAIKEMKLA